MPSAPKSLEKILIQRNKEASRPLSLLYLNATNLEELNDWRKWIRRAVVFTKEVFVYYHLIALALNDELYRRMNLKIGLGDFDQISKNKQIVWRFDLIYLNEVDSNIEIILKKLMDLQFASRVDFLLIIKLNDNSELYSPGTISNFIIRTGVNVEILPAGKVTQGNKLMIFKIRYSSGIKSRIDFDTEEITDTMLWE
ncbi:MAG: hypothetical protein K0R31_2176 [Clostridiales bacterium]|jgi:hypothetical protein|nr:hypothetical protein [Clostridiales bacterium]